MIWFSADTHLSNINIIQYENRPWKNPQEMNEGLINNWNSVVDNSDTVYFLGDFAMGQIAESLPLALKLNGTKYLIPGNHDRCWFGNKKYQDWIKRYEDVGFEIIGNKDGIYPADNLFPEVELEVDMCHFPFEGDSGDVDRYQEYRPEDDGRWLIHGHVHSKWKYKGRMINVGVDTNNYFPISIEKIKEYMNSHINLEKK